MARASQFTAVVALMVFAVGCKSAPSPAPAPEPPPPRADASVPVDSAPASALSPDVRPAADAGIVVADSAPAAPAAAVNRLEFRSGVTPPRGAQGAHGANVWAVVLGAGMLGNVELHGLFQRAVAAHLAASEGQVACSQPVSGSYPAAVPSGDDAAVVSVQFANERDARRFVGALVEAPIWVGRVHLMCAD